MIYYTADSYKDYERLKEYEKDGKMYATVRTKCSRCTKGVYVTRVENGQPIPHPAYGGVCLKCGGTGYIQKEVRLYTEEEYAKNAAAAQKRAEKKKVERQKKMEEEFESKKAIWLEKNGFNDKMTTFVYFPDDSYQVKNELKNAGFQFSGQLLWHSPNIPAGYEEKVVEITLDMVADISAWGEGFYRAGCRDVVEDALSGARPLNNSEWIGEVGEKVKGLKVILKSTHSFETRYGYTRLLKFEDMKGNIICWFTSTYQPYEINDTVFITGTIKAQDEYKGVKQTTLTRCRLKEA